MASFVLRGRAAALLTGFTVAVSALTLSTTAEARYRHFRHHTSGAYAPPYAAMVVDANSGKVLYARNENELRHPASLTKVMTLYLLFEQLEKGRFALDSEIKISAHAAAQQPSKLGLNPGETIAIEDAIKAVVTRSANDVAVAIAEAISGDEDTFAEAMTRKAHQLGMSKTYYQNASGLPNEDQVTTARDLTVLGRAIQDRFPKYYRYFATHHFDYAGETIMNHNKLLGRVEGVDGIKTGFTTASGFNLLTSVKREGHALVASVLGGRSGRERDQIMTGLIEDNIDSTATRRTVAAIGDKPSGEAIKVASNEPVKLQPLDSKPAPKPLGKPQIVANASTEEEDDDTAAAALKPAQPLPTGKPMPLVTAQMTSELPKARPAVLSATPKAPATDAVKTIAKADPAKADPTKGDANGKTDLAAAKPMPLDGSTKARPLVAVAALTPPAAIAPAAPAQPAMRWVQGPAGIDLKKGDLKTPPKLALAPKPALAYAAPDAMPTATLVPRPKGLEPKGLSAKSADPKLAAGDAKTTTSVAVNAAEPAAPAHTGWMIQIGAADDVNKANALLNKAKSESKGFLASASPFTEKVQKGDQTLYRARFAGLEADEATNACKRLKQSGFACFPTKN